MPAPVQDIEDKRDSSLSTSRKVETAGPHPAEHPGPHVARRVVKAMMIQIVMATRLIAAMNLPTLVAGTSNYLRVTLARVSLHLC